MFVFNSANQTVQEIRRLLPPLIHLGQETLYELVKALQCLLLPRGQIVTQKIIRQSLPQGSILLMGKITQLLQTHLPDTALGGGNGTNKGRVIIMVGQKPQVG